MDIAKPFEEETLPCYKPEQFYPVHVGQTLNASFTVLGKLGNQDYPDYVTIKVCTQEAAKSTRLHRELQFYEHVSSIDSNHIGTAFIRSLFEVFEISGPTGKHLCLVHPPMHMTIRELQFKNPSHRLNEPLMKWMLLNTFRALSFLHDEAHVVHSDINPGNIMLTIDDKSLLSDFEKAEQKNPSPRKVIDSARTIYGSRAFGLPKGIEWGQPVLCDFGEARIGDVHEGLVQPELYRAPEVLFDMPWDSSIDLWSVAVMIWDLFENQHLFNAQDEEKKSSATHHISEIIAYLGMPPPEYTSRSENMQHVFNSDGSWKWTGKYDIPAISLETSEHNLSGENKHRFLDFVRSILRWLPEERKSATELLKDPWLNSVIT